MIRISVKVDMYMPTKMKIMEAEERLKNAHMTQCPYCHTGMVEQACAICESL